MKYVQYKEIKPVEKPEHEKPTVVQLSDHDMLVAIYEKIIWRD